MSTNLHIDDIGNLILRDGTLGFFVSSQYITPPHYGGGRVGALCPYVYCAGDPVNFIDPTGCSTQVAMIDSTHYEVVGGDVNDDDTNIYVVQKDENGEYQRTGAVLGQTPTMTSFYNPNSGDFENAIIDLNDHSGMNFLGLLDAINPNCVIYGFLALLGMPLDFKKTNGTLHDLTKNIDNTKKTAFMYRGMPLGIGAQGERIITSARDIGNIAAGSVANRNGLSWSLFRTAADALETFQHNDFKIHTEGITTQNAERYGYNQLHRLLKRK